jgi:hypothetical protein
MTVFAETAMRRKCARCGERFTLALHQGRNSDKARAARRKVYQRGQRYCSATCRKMASKARQASPKIGPKPLSAATPLSGVTSVSSAPMISMSYEQQKSARPALQMTFGGYAVVLDADWPKMYRVRRPDGSLTDMVNLSRARDAARCLSGAA